MNQMIKTIKEVHQLSVCMYRIGSFYHRQGKDGYIMSYMYGYKIKEISQEHKECGFPLNSINRIIAKLEEAKIDYMIKDRRNNNDVEESVEIKKDNK